MPSNGSEKIYVLPPQEDWIVDRMTDEWYTHNADISTRSPQKADVIWLMADWAWQALWHVGLLKNKKVLTTVHHIVPEKFGPMERADFELRDTVTTAYHVFNQYTHDFIRPLTLKPIHLIKYWANQDLWRPTGTKEEFRKKYKLPLDVFLVGSFQRDTEGSSLVLLDPKPKLEKGPDKFVDYVKMLSQYRAQHQMSPVAVLLGGWRRQYITTRLRTEAPHIMVFSTAPEDRMQKWFEYPQPVPVVWTSAKLVQSQPVPLKDFLPPLETINELYQCLDQYAVTARQEGGPQALIECGLLGVPTVSTPVGIAEQVLPPSAICENVFSASPAVPNVENWKLPGGFELYRELLQSL